MGQIANIMHTSKIVILALAWGMPALAQEDAGVAKEGEQLVTAQCARCHAVGRSGSSPHPQAPPFRTLSERYPIENLEEGLVEGFSSGHPDMPEFVFEPGQAEAIVAYLKTIQTQK